MLVLTRSAASYLNKFQHPLAEKWIKERKERKDCEAAHFVGAANAKQVAERIAALQLCKMVFIVKDSSLLDVELKTDLVLDFGKKMVCLQVKSSPAAAYACAEKWEKQGNKLKLESPSIAEALAGASPSVPLVVYPQRDGVYCVFSSKENPVLFGDYFQQFLSKKGTLLAGGALAARLRKLQQA